MDIYGNGSDEGYENDDDLHGLTIHDNLNGAIGDYMTDATDDWLSINDDQLEGNSPSELMGAATNADLQLGRIGHVEPRIQAGIKAILSGQNVNGIHPVDAAAAREQFAQEIGSQNLEAFARQIKIDEVVEVPRGERDLNTVVSMLQNTSGSYLERGPGKTLPGNEFDGEKQAKSDSDLMQATRYINELTDLYIDGRTVGSTVEGARRKAVSESITKRLMDGTFYDGSSISLPLPNETGVTGIVPTQGIYSSFQGTAEDRLSSSQFDTLYQQLPSDGSGRARFVRDESGFKKFRDDVPQEVRNDALRRTPSLSNSLFPKPRPVGKQTFTAAEKAKHSRDQSYAMGQAQFKANFARNVLRQQFPTTRDESKGQIRMSGWDTPYGDQADLQNLRNEAAIQGVEWNSKFAGQADDDIQSELTQYIEDATEITPNTSGEIKQGTQAWLAQRKGKITASTAAGLLKSGGIEERAVELAMERLGTSTPFTGNAHTREGNEGEDRAARAFLAGAGRGLTMKEAFFEEDPSKPGFGVSPDGRLYDEEGESAGLLELKYLSSGSMAGALNKYTPQMQMQMAIGGESQTHFYALDKYTGEYVHEIVKADPIMQAQLLEAGQQALELGASLDNRGVQALRNKIASDKINKPRQAVGADKVTGQQSSIELLEEVEEGMTAFQMATMAGVSSSGGGSASKSALGKMIEKQDQTARMKQATEDAKDASPDAGISQSELRKSGLLEVAAYAEDSKREADKAKEADKATAAAAKEASDNLREFSGQVKKAANVAGELAGLVLGGNKSGMDEVRLGASVGLEETQVRGMREAMEMGGMEAGGINKTISAAGGLVSSFNDEATSASTFTNLMSARGRSNQENVRNMAMPSIQEFQGMNAQQLTSTVAGLMQGKSAIERTQIGKMFGMPELATYDQDPSTINQVDTSINGEAQRNTYRQSQAIEQLAREGQEEVAEQVNGGVASSAKIGAAVVGSATMGVLASKASTLLSAAQPSSKMAGVVKGLSTAAKATPIALVASLAPMATRSLTDIKDDGSIGDSLLDVAEFAAYGAAAGSVVPGIGTAIGAGVGALVGAGNEAWEYFNEEDALPSTSIGNMPMQGRPTPKSSGNIVNVEVSNEISPDLIRTSTNVNGDLNVDEETGLGTGG